MDGSRRERTGAARRAKSEFVATASHELRSPLTSIKGFVELLQRAPDLSSRQREFVDIILRSTDRLVDLVNDLLDVARIEADRVELNRRPIYVGEEIREVTELMGPQIADKRQQLNAQVAPALPAALADASRVRRIVANLLTNAHLYSGEGGTIEVSVARPPGWVEIIVADDGPGMARTRSRACSSVSIAARTTAAALRERDWDCRSSSRWSTSRVARSRSTASRGGEDFHVRLPRAERPSDVADSITAIRGRRVLVVDDETDIAGLIAGQLGALDVHAEIVTSGESALARLREDHSMR